MLTRCQHCGKKRPQNYDQEAGDPEVYQARKRAGFTTFYLWFGLIVNTIIGLAYFATIFTRKGLWTAYDPMYTRVYGFVASAILVLGYLLLMRWKKSGFYVLIGMAAVTLMMNLFSGETISFATFFPIISALILYAVLQIRKNGISCWEQLS